MHERPADSHGKSLLSLDLGRRELLRLTAAGIGGLAVASQQNHDASASASSRIGGPGSMLAAQDNPYGTPTKTGGTYVALSRGPGFPHIFIPISYFGTTAFLVCKLVYTPLILLDRDWKTMGPGLASSWEWSADGKQLTVHLQPGIQFHDGAEVTAADVEFTFKLMVRKEDYPAVQDKSIFQGGNEYMKRETEDFAGVTVIDDHTVQFNLAEPSSVFLLNLSNTGILPAHAFAADALTSDVGIEDLAFFKEMPIGTGPFKVKSFDLTSNVTLEANKSYFKGAPILDGIVIRFGVAAAAQIAGVLSGEVDGLLTGTYQDAKALADNADLAFVSTFAMGNVQLLTVATEKPYMNVSVRQGLAHAVDVDSLIASVTYGNAKPAPSVITWAPLFPNPALPAYPYDVERAKQLLTAGGWSPSQKLRVAQFTEQGAPENILAALINMWKAAGVDTEYVPLDRAQEVDLQSAADHNYDLVLDQLAWQAYDPTANYAFFACGQPQNYSHYCNADWDALMTKAMHTADQAETIKDFQQLQVTLQTDLPEIPLWMDPDIWVINKRVHGGNLGRGPINDVQAELWWKE